TVAGGLQGLADRYGMFAHASGFFSAQGDAQAVEFVLRNTTSGVTPAVLYLDGTSANRLTIRTDTQLSGICTISGIKSDGSELALFQRSLVIKNIGGTTTLVHVSTISTDHKDDAAWALAITADNANSALQIQCTGNTGDDVRWVAVLRGLEIAIG
ncbi:MAG: hypothetical protein EBR40_09130, partial [Proteobacteria bacterium]|nr:hypothetical protein [Pseudomonadota bacterium]